MTGAPADPTKAAAAWPPIACLTGVAAWQRRRVRALVGGHLPHAATAARAVALAAERSGAVASWTGRAPPGLAAIALAAGVPVYRLADGFIRSAGQGARLAQPCSIVIDRLGDPDDGSATSELERLLAGQVFPADLLARAVRLTEQIVARGITRDNLPGRPVGLPTGRRLVLVAGQAADRPDADMPALLAAVRAMEPDAFILYRPHPAVQAGLRPGALPVGMVLAHADAVVRRAALAPLLARVDAVHVATSLTGFEALLRGREVVCHGQPFYAGWGLTHDLAPLPRRTRRLSLAELAAGALILTPRYCDPLTGRPATPEALVDRLASLPRRRAPIRGTAARVGAGWRRLRG